MFAKITQQGTRARALSPAPRRQQSGTTESRIIEPSLSFVSQFLLSNTSSFLRSIASLPSLFRLLCKTIKAALRFLLFPVSALPPGSKATTSASFSGGGMQCYCRTMPYLRTASDPCLQIQLSRLTCKNNRTPDPNMTTYSLFYLAI